MVDVCGALEKTVRVLRWRTPADVQVDREFRCTEPIAGDAAALNQVWLNLLDNALRAVGKTGKIQIATERVENDLVVTMTDTGPGIPHDQLERIFEPFFSTRAAGEGTGLGLAISRRIVSQHGGRLSVFSEPGKGTRFAVALPMKDVGTHTFTLPGEPDQIAQRN